MNGSARFGAARLSPGDGAGGGGGGTNEPVRGDLEQWGKSVKKRPEKGRAEGGKVRRPWKKIVLLGAGVVVVLLVVLIALAPTIVSAGAPGQIESAASSRIKGKVRVKSVSLGWFSPTEVESLEVVDPEGKTAATVSVRSPATLWRVITEHWWSARRLDVGEVEASGSLDIVRDAVTGQTNLQRALEPSAQAASAPAKPAPGGGGGGLESVKGVLRLTRFDATVREKDAADKLSPEQGVKGLKGAVSVDYVANPAAVVAAVDLVGSPVGVGADAGGDVKIKVDATVKPKAGGGLESFACKADVMGLPVQIVDAMAKQGGALVGALGARAEVHVDASGTPSSADAKLGLASPGATADLSLSLRDGMLTSAPGGKVVVKSTEFVSSLPALRASMEKAAKQVTLDKAPGLEIDVEKLRWPVPASGDMSAADFRGAGVELKVHVDGMSGRVAMQAPSAGSGVAGARVDEGLWKAFSVQPIDLVVGAGDLSRPVTISGGTRATVDGSAAGDFSVRASAAGLLDSAGHLRVLAKSGGGMADDLSAEVKVDGASTALLQPVVTASGLPVDMKTDVGPTLSATASVRADVKGVDVSAGTPPVDVALNVASANVRVDAAGRYEKGIARTTGEGVRVNIASASGLVQRLMSKPGQAATLEISGTGAATLTVKDFSVPTDKLKGMEALGAMKGTVGVEVSQVRVTRITPGAPNSGVEVKPIDLTKADVNVVLDGVNPPRMDVDASLSHAGTPFGLVGEIKLEGIKGKLPENAGSGAAQIIAFRPTGRIELKDVPRSMAVFVPGAEMVGAEPTGTEMPAQIARALRESIGSSATVTITTQPDPPGAQTTSVKLTTQAGGVSANVGTKLTDKALTVSTLEASLAMSPAVVNPVLASAGQAGAGEKQDATRSVAVPLKLAQPFTLALKSGGAITVPLKAGTFEPDFAGASDAAVSLSTDNDIAIDNVPIGADAGGAARTTGVRVKSLKADVTAPLSGLAPEGKGKKLSATFSAIASRSEGNATIADVHGTVSAAMDNSTPPTADVDLKVPDTAVVEGLIGRPGLLTGALGDHADASVKVSPQKDGQLIALSLTAPKVSDARIELLQGADSTAITKPAVITWKPDAASLNRLLFPPIAAGADGKGGAASAVTVTSSAPITVTVQQLAIASSRTVNGEVTGGPLRPGVFALDASIVTPSLGLTAAGAGGAGGAGGSAGAAPTAIMLSGISAGVKYQPPAQGNAFGEVRADVGIDKVAGGTGEAAKKSTATVRLANLADAKGVLTTKSAVVNLDADLASFPTPIVDSLANQKGMLSELLGPTIDVQANVVNVSLAATDVRAAAGSVRVKATSPRASANINGDVRGGEFVQNGVVNARLLQITPQLVTKLGGDAIPMVASVEKTLQDEPGTFDASGLTVPLDSDMTKLNGDMTIDPGVVRFTTKSIWGTLIEGFGGKGKGSLGDRLQPVKVHADKGVLTYQQFKLPVGSFTLETRGTVDLVRKQMDVVTYAPIGSLTSKAVGDLNTGIAGKLGLFDKSTMVPITTKGPLGQTKTEIDFGLFAKEQADKLLKNPGKILGDVLGDVLNKGKPKPPGK
ncbi:MAG TPA: hypothetical protein VHC70_15090 [Phycisphaerales bacterium]|nr:hypothetical protein [Phycisphaerales bacterium]